MKRIKIVPSILFAALALTFAACQPSAVENEATEVTLEDISAMVNKLNPKNVINASIVNDSLSYEIGSGFEDGFTTSGGTVVCRGSGVRFARCVQRELDAGHTLKLYKDGDEYVAERMHKE